MTDNELELLLDQARIALDEQLERDRASDPGCDDRLVARILEACRALQFKSDDC
jgi:hypothetical protein